MRIGARFIGSIRRHLLGSGPPRRPANDPDAFLKEFGLDPADLAGIILEVEELWWIANEIAAKRNASLLVFGCGNDSVLWEKINRSGTTVFLEHNSRWAAETRKKLSTAAVYDVHYDTKRPQWRDLLDCPAKLEMELPPEVRSRRWDVILVDGPTGFDDETPGRMKSIYAASQLVARGGRVFVHDCDRSVEDEYSTRYLGRRRLFVERAGRAVLRGYAF